MKLNVKQTLTSDDLMINPNHYHPDVRKALMERIIPPNKKRSMLLLQLY